MLSYTKLVFSTFTGPGEFWVLSIDFDSNEAEVLTLVQKTTLKLDKCERRSIENRVLESQIEEWGTKYERSFYDGFRWSLPLYNGDTEIKKVSGVNDYPPSKQWQPFMSMIHRLYDRTIKDGETEIFPAFNTPCGTDTGK